MLSAKSRGVCVSGAGYTSLLKDESFTHLNARKVRHLLSLALAEMLGVALFMAMGCGGVVSTIAGAEPNLLTIVLSFAFGIATSIIIFMHISGAFMNPALNIVAVFLVDFSIPKLVLYTVFQLIGSVLGVGFIKAVTPNLEQGFCVPQPNPDVSLLQAAAVEFAASFVLCMSFAAVLDKRMAPNVGAIWVKFGVAIVAIALPAAKYSGCGMNPARTFGPALVMNHWNYQWMYWVAPCSAAVLVGLIMKYIFDPALAEPAKEDNDPV